MRAGGGAHRSVPAPLRRGTAVVAVAGGALTLMGSASPMTGAVAPAAVAAPDALLVPSVEPVVPVPEVLDASRLVAAVRRTEEQVLAAKAEEARKAAARRAEQAAAAECGLDTSGLGGVTRATRAAAEFFGCRFGEPTMYGVAGRAGASDHPSGKAVDFMVDRATGDALASCALENRDAFGITYVIWRQRINYGSGWHAMEDRGGITANHMDHVHVSFGARASGEPAGC